MKPRRSQGILDKIKTENPEEIARQYEEQEQQYDLEKEDEEVDERAYQKPKRKLVHLQVDSKVFLIRCSMGSEK